MFSAIPPIVHGKLAIHASRITPSTPPPMTTRALDRTRRPRRSGASVVVGRLMGMDGAADI
jgi:hypothetical protein